MAYPQSNGGQGICPWWWSIYRLPSTHHRVFPTLFSVCVWHWTMDINIRVYHKTITYDLRTRCLPSVLDCVAGWLAISVVMVGVDNDVTRILPLPQIDTGRVISISCWYLSIYWERLLSTYINCRVQHRRVEGSCPSGTRSQGGLCWYINIRKWFLWNFGIGWNAGKGSAPFKVSLPSRLLLSTVCGGKWVQRV